MTTTTATPTGVLVGSYEPGTPGWRAARAGSITATRIPALLGLSPWESPFSLWHRMAGHVTDTAAPSPEMEWGVRLEPVVAERFADDHPEWRVTKTGTWQHHDRAWQRATPDRLLLYPDGTSGALLECKTSPFGDGWGRTETGEIPIYYRAQVLWQLDTLGLDTAHIAVLIGGYDYREYTVTADPDEAAFMRDRATEFLASLDEGTAPRIDGHDETYRVVRQLPDGVDTAVVDIGPALADRYRDAREAVQAAESELTEAKSLVLARLGNSLRAEALGELIAYRTTYPDGTTRALQPARSQNTKAR